ncbi:MAG: DUF2515 family protein [Bacillaceae bacterium]
MTEVSIIEQIKEKTMKANQDNVTRTEAYEQFYKCYPEVQWALLAGAVSRNAGWNMCDLEGTYFTKALSLFERRRIFLLYERANWLIFSDAYPQLLIYEYSKTIGKPCFDLFSHFYCSTFMEKEWMNFWQKGDKQRLAKALIINEQFLIQEPVIENTYFKQQVFHSFHYRLQELCQFNFVLFPTLNGQLYGYDISHFEEVKERIKLGYGLYKLLFHPLQYTSFLKFFNQVPHTGSRWDYEVYIEGKVKKDTPSLQDVYPVIPHRRTRKILGIDDVENQESYFLLSSSVALENRQTSFLLKQRQLHFLLSFQQILS